MTGSDAQPVTVARSGDPRYPVSVGIGKGGATLTIDQALDAAAALLSCAAAARRDERRTAAT